jgi:chorismate synthase
MITILDGLPAGLKVDRPRVNDELAKRMLGYGRGKRMSVESDNVEILSGLKSARTIGSPVSMLVKNADDSIDRLPKVYAPRPGHADLAGILKYNLDDVREVLERASARETVARVAVGAVCKILLEQFGISVSSRVISIGKVAGSADSPKVRAEIDRAAKAGDTLGGVFSVAIRGVPPGLGSHVQWDRKIDANLSRAVMSIQAIKAVAFGLGFKAAALSGSKVHDEIFFDKKKGFYRKTNNAGGIEGGMTTGEDIIMSAAMKPISTLMKPLSTVDIRTKKRVKAAVERSDVCAVPAAAVIGEAVSAFEIANAFIEKFGGDSMEEMKRNYKGYIAQIKKA